MGRFDFPGAHHGILYLSELPEHAVAEAIQGYRNQRLGPADLRVSGRTLALASTGPHPDVGRGVVDLCDADVLARLEINPDDIAARTRATTQRIAGKLYAVGNSGLRWWSAFFGEWHTVVLFWDRLPTPLVFREPTPLTLEEPAVREAAHQLNIEM